MASMVAKANTNQVSPAITVQEKGSRNKRKFRADLPPGDSNKILSSPQNECPSYEFSAEKFEITSSHGRPNGCDMCSIHQDHSDALKLDLGLLNTVASPDTGANRPREETEVGDDFHDADWSELTETQLEELVLSNLDAIFKGAIKKLVACGYSEEVATKAVLRPGLCYGCKDTVSNIVDNTLAFLRNGQEIDPSRDHYFEDLKQMRKYILAELVCVLREVRPFFSTGDAMWCLLICDMNVSLACALDGDNSINTIGDGALNLNSSVSVQPNLRIEPKSSEINLPNPSQPSPAISCTHNCSETPTVASSPCAHSCKLDTPIAIGAPNFTKPKSSLVHNRLVPEKESLSSTSDTLDKTPAPEEKFGCGRKISGITKREYVLRQKSLHLEKNYRTYGSKGSSRAGKISGFGGLMLDKKLKSVSESAGVNAKNSSLKISKAIGLEIPLDSGNINLPANVGVPPSGALNLEPVNTIVPILPKTNAQPELSAADTELSLSLTLKSPFDRSLEQWVPQDKKEEMILKLVPKVRELQNQLQEWTEWANQKVMQAARRLGKDKAELKTLRQEREEVERLKREKQTLEENTMKKLSEMENALSKASGQVDRANSAVRRLEVENAVLRQEMEAAKLQAAESAASCQEQSKREKKSLMDSQSGEKQKTLFQEELVAEKRKLAQLQQEVEQAKDLRDHLEARWKQEEKAKEELLIQAGLIRKEREQLEVSAKSKEDMIKMKAENSLQKYKDDIEKLEKEFSQLRLKTDSSKIAALRRGIDGNYASKVADVKNSPAPKESRMSYISGMMREFEENNGTGGVKRERECVMCLSEEMSVVFLPCAHQVVCTSCNDLHEKQGMKDCPSCRSTIQRRISVRYARS